MVIAGTRLTTLLIIVLLVHFIESIPCYYYDSPLDENAQLRLETNFNFLSHSGYKFRHYGFASESTTLYGNVVAELQVSNSTGIRSLHKKIASLPVSVKDRTLWLSLKFAFLGKVAIGVILEPNVSNLKEKAQLDACIYNWIHEMPFTCPQDFLVLPASLVYNATLSGNANVSDTELQLYSPSPFYLNTSDLTRYKKTLKFALKRGRNSMLLPPMLFKGSSKLKMNQKFSLRLLVFNTKTHSYEWSTRLRAVQKNRNSLFPASFQYFIDFVLPSSVLTILSKSV